MNPLAVIPFVVITITTMVILIFRDSRIVTGALLLQYLSAFFLVALSWPTGMAAVKLIVGWMSASALALTQLRQNQAQLETESSASLIFRGLAGFLVILVIFTLAPQLRLSIFPQVDLIVLQSGLILMGMALMQLGTSGDPFLLIVSLLSLLSGFEIIYAALERSALLTGLLAIVNLSLTLVGIYFLSYADKAVDALEDKS